jgi:hypothetical protein
MKKLVLVAFLLIGAVSFAQEGVYLKKSSTLRISEVPPTWPGCDGSINQKNNCFKQKLANHVVQGFKFPKGHKAGTKVVVDMIVNKYGKPEIKSMQGGSKPLQAEIKRQIMSMPQVKPGHEGGTPKESSFKLPFTF